MKLDYLVGSIASLHTSYVTLCTSLDLCFSSVGRMNYKGKKQRMESSWHMLARVMSQGEFGALFYVPTSPTLFSI